MLFHLYFLTWYYLPVQQNHNYCFHQYLQIHDPKFTLHTQKIFSLQDLHSLVRTATNSLESVLETHRQSDSRKTAERQADLQAQCKNTGTFTELLSSELHARDSDMANYFFNSGRDEKDTSVKKWPFSKLKRSKDNLAYLSNVNCICVPATLKITLNVSGSFLVGSTMYVTLLNWNQWCSLP